MTINIIVYGIYKSIRKRKNMFPIIMREMEAKATLFKHNFVLFDSQEDEEENNN